VKVKNKVEHLNYVNERMNKKVNMNLEIIKQLDSLTLDNVFIEVSQKINCSREKLGLHRK
jgi:hypothetical protein